MNCFQCVSINGVISDILLVSSGVPQGSILEPLLLIIFINALPTNIVPSRVLQFADDVKCTLPVSGFDDCTQLQRDTARLLEWSHLWELPFNEKKCISTSRKYVCVTISYLNNLMLTVVNTSDLGVVFSENLKWGPHYKMIVSRAYKILGLLHRVFSTISCAHSKRIIYLTLVKPLPAVLTLFLPLASSPTL